MSCWKARIPNVLAHILNRLVHGSASSFNQQTNVDLTNKYTVLDISELTGSSDLFNGRHVRCPGLCLG
mgnify:CR=1 FL=1